MAYSLDLRIRAVQHAKETGDNKLTSNIFGISVRSLTNWLAKDKVGDLRDCKPKRPWKKINPKQLSELVDNNPSFRLEDFANHFNVSITAIHLAFKKLGITRKKRLNYTKKEMCNNDRYLWKKLPSYQKKT